MKGSIYAKNQLNRRTEMRPAVGDPAGVQGVQTPALY